MTRNTEYHCRDDICVAVFDRASNRFVDDHRAIGHKISAAVRFTDGGSIASISRADDVHVGERLCFALGSRDEPRDLVTTAVRAITRPPKEAVAHYAS